jgi:hypothetical protein
MTQHGEMSTSSTTVPSQENGSPQEVFNLQKEVMDKCLNIVQQFRVNRISKPRASLQLQQVIPHENTKEDSFILAYGSYLKMLNNFKQYQSGVARRISETGELLGNGQPDARQEEEGQFELGTPIAHPSK